METWPLFVKRHRITSFMAPRRLKKGESGSRENSFVFICTVPSKKWTMARFQISRYILLIAGRDSCYSTVRTHYVVRDCAIIIRRGGGGAKMSLARRNIAQYPPLNKRKLALTPLQISQKLWRTPPPPPPPTPPTNIVIIPESFTCFVLMHSTSVSGTKKH